MRSNAHAAKYLTPGYFRYDSAKDLGPGSDIERATKNPCSAALILGFLAGCHPSAVVNPAPSPREDLGSISPALQSGRITDRADIALLGARFSPGPAASSEPAPLALSLIHI